MGMTPQFTQGVFSQELWPGVGDIDDCWCLSDLVCLHSIAPWLWLPGIVKYRGAAGAPDDPTKPSPGSIDHSAKAIRAIWPAIGAKIEVFKGVTIDLMIRRIRAGRPVSLSVGGSALPAELRRYSGDHRIAAFVNGTTLRYLDPLWKPHAKPQDISEYTLRKAIEAHSLTGARGIVFPTVEESFVTHPLYVAPTAASQAAVDAATAPLEARITTKDDKITKAAALLADALDD